MTHVSEPQTMAQQINKCSKHAFYMHYAVIWKYIDKCAYAVITNFGCPKADLCVACGDNAESPFCPNY